MGRLRLTARLVDAGTGIHIWAQRYTRELCPGFASLDAITANIAASIAPHIYAAEESRLRRTPLHALDATGCVTMALSAGRTRSRQGVAAAERLLQRAIELDPACARAHSLSSWFAGVEVIFGWKSREDAIGVALDAAQKAVFLDDHDPWSHFALGWALTQNREPEGGIEEHQRALAINPYFLPAYSCLGVAFGHLGQTEKALTVLENGKRLDAAETFVGLDHSCRAGVYFCAENHRDAIAAARRKT